MGRRKRAAVPFTLFAFQDIITSVTGIILLITMMMAVELVQNLTRAEAAPQEQKSARIVSQLRQAVSEGNAETDRLRKILDETTTIRFDADSLRRRFEQLQAAATELASQNDQIQSTQQEINARRQQQSEDAKQLSPEAIAALVNEQKAVAEQIAAMRQSNRIIFNRPESAAKSPWLVELNETSIVTAEMGQVRTPLSFASTDEFLQWVGNQDHLAQYFVLLVKPSSIDTFSVVRKALQERQFDVGYDLLRSDQTAIDPQTGAGVP